MQEEGGHVRGSNITKMKVRKKIPRKLLHTIEYLYGELDQMILYIALDDYYVALGSSAHWGWNLVNDFTTKKSLYIKV